MSLTASAHEATVRFGEATALDGLNITLPAGRIIGLLGRNGAGKSTFLRLLAGYLRPTSGQVLVDGTDPFEDARIMRETVLVREAVAGADSLTVTDHLEVAAALRPRWGQDLAADLTERFQIPAKRKISKLSHGQRGALNVLTGLASRAPLTLLDEPHLGMDTPSRYAFYDTLLADYVEHPRTIVLATHLIEEIARLIDVAVIIDQGRLLVHDTVDSLCAGGIEVTGPGQVVDEVTRGRRILSSRRLGHTVSVVIHDEYSDELSHQARERGLDVAPLPLQDLFVHLTAGSAPVSQEGRSR